MDQQWRMSRPGDDALAVWLSLGISALALSTANSFHWFLIPTTICGALIGGDALRWLRGRVDAFDPVGIVGVGGFFFFYLAPILHVAWNHWMPEVTGPPDWRDWIGEMAIFNSFGLVAYRLARASGSRASRERTVKWSLQYDRFLRNSILLMILSLALQLWVYSRFEGISGYIRSFETSPDEFEGLGIVFIFSESFPVVLFLLYVVWAKRTFRRVSWLHLIAIPLFCAFLLLFGGLRGSRSHTIYGAFWAVGVFHVYLRPISRKAIVVGFAAGLVFAYIFGFYKIAGLRGLQSVTDPAARTLLEQQSGRTVKGLILGDLSRSDVQAYLTYRLSTDSGYSYAWGRTYLGAASLLLPKTIFINRQPTKVKEGTQLLHGVGKYDPENFASARVYGLGGEALLNFGPAAIPPAYWLLGKVVRRCRRWNLQWSSDDSRLLLVPLTVILCYVFLAGDSDNLVVFSLQYFMLPFMLLRASSKRIPA
jgi:hypothetical protein